MVDLFKRMFGKDVSPANSPARAVPEPEAVAAARADEARLAARRAQISNDLFELQQIAMAELALRREQDAAAAKAGFEAEDGVGGRILTV
ncbi:MAG: hypothetical protein U5N27_14635 [Rhizobium sp.]|nr:hypothetical protein [Rhizobium sp.]